MISNDILFDGSNNSLHMRNHLKIHDGTHDDFLIGGGIRRYTIMMGWLGRRRGLSKMGGTPTPLVADPLTGSLPLCAPEKGEGGVTLRRRERGVSRCGTSG